LKVNKLFKERGKLRDSEEKARDKSEPEAKGGNIDRFFIGFFAKRAENGDSNHSGP